jgi:predicted lipase
MLSLIPKSVTISLSVKHKIQDPLSSKQVIDYRACALSAARSKIAYLTCDEVKALWLASTTACTTSKTLFNYVFEGVTIEPKYYEDSASGLNAYSWLQDRTLHFVFRGTSGATDIKIDIDEQRVQLFPDKSSILVHRGFCKQLRSIQTQMLMEIEQLTSLIDVVHFSGHSLGGAVATLAAGVAASASSNTCRVICHTIGSPRVGNKAFVRWWSNLVAESARVQNFKDPIPLFPINGLYTHIHEAVEINDSGDVKVVPKDSPWYCRLLRLPFEIYYRNPFANHACDLYIQRLLTLASWTIDIGCARV